MIEKQRPFRIGERVKGVYHGQHYSGVVDFARPHTMNLSYLHYIKLDEVITVYGDPRDRILVSIWDPMESGNTIEAATPAEGNT